MITMKNFNLFLISLGIFFILNGCQKKSESVYQGYAEGEFVNISSSQSGTLDKLFIKRGEEVPKDANLFALECRNEVFAVQQTASELSAALATLNDYKKGSRPEEIRIIQAQLSAAVANADNAKQQADRNTQLYYSHAVSQEQFDNSVALKKSTSAKLQELHNTLSAARLSKRSDQITAQEARIGQLQAVLAQAQWKLNEKALKSRGNALVFDTLYHEGEWVPSGGIVVRLLPPENIKIRFFVPQAISEQLSINHKATIVSRSDGKKIPAHVTYISTEAEYTPPIIYSNETKDQLTYMIEAYPDTADAVYLHPGQPVEVSLGF